ncbi:MAG: hypothetical protein Q9222_003113 [Ikaeria aurantiellina]
MTSENGTRDAPSLTFQRAIEKFTKTLTAKQKADFGPCKLEDVYETVEKIQKRRGSERTLRNMARLQSFLEAMDQYRRVVEAFLNCTPFLGYVWGPIRFILLVADTWIKSFDTILDAYKEIEERLPAFIKYKALFENNSGLRRALEFYFCDILEFHFHAMKFLDRPGWKRLFDSSWKTFDTRFRQILDSLERHKDLIESEKGTLVVVEVQKTREIAEAQSKEAVERAGREKVNVLVEKLDPTDYGRDQYAASEQRRQHSSGAWILQNPSLSRWSDLNAECNPLLYLHGIPGAGKTIISSFVIERLMEEKSEPVLYFYCKQNHTGKLSFTDVLSSLLAQLIRHDSAIAACIYDMCASKDRLGVLSLLENLAEIAFESQAGCFVVIDGLDECDPREAERIIRWLVTRQKTPEQGNVSQLRLLFVGQRTETLLQTLNPAVKISLDIPEHQSDIVKYVVEASKKLRDEFGLDAQTEAQIAKRVTTAASSMFLFAKLVMENLLNQVTQSDVLQQLEPDSFPVDLEAAYERICETAFKDGPQKKAVIKIIGWTVCTSRKLRWREVQAAFYVVPGQNHSDYNGRKLRKTCKQLCGSLVDLSTQPNDPPNEAILEIVHHTARGYLIQKGLINQSLQHLEMANFCLDYLLSSPLTVEISKEALGRHCESGFYALHEYALVHWFDHYLQVIDDRVDNANEAQVSLISKYRSLLENTDDSESISMRFRETDPDQTAEIFDDSPRDARSRDLRYQVGPMTSRIRKVIEAMVEGFKDDDPARFTLCDIYGFRAFKCGKVDCHHYLEGFDTRSERDRHLQKHDRPHICIHKGCPFQVLGFEHHRQLQKHLETAHATEDEDRFTFPKARKKNADTLCKAAARGDIAAVQELLGQGHAIEQPSRTNGGQTPLILAAGNGHSHVLRLLLEKGANAWYRGPRQPRVNAFDAAIASGDLETMYYLLNTPEVHSHLKPDDESLASILKSACRMRRTAMVKLILDEKWSNERHYCFSKTYKVAFYESVLSADKTLAQSVIKYLRKHAIHGFLNDFAEKYRSKAFFASLFQLDDHIIDLHEWDEAEGGVLHLMLDHNQMETIQLCIKSGIFNPNATNEDGLTLLCRLVSMRYRGIYTTLIEALLEIPRTNPNTVDKTGQSPLIRAAQSGSHAHVQVLLAADQIEVNIVDNEGRTALSRALEHGPPDIVRLLRSAATFDINAQDDRGETMLTRAVRAARHREVMQLSEMEGIDLQLQNNEGKTAVRLAYELQMLCEHAKKGTSNGLFQFMSPRTERLDLRSIGKEVDRWIGDQEVNAIAMKASAIQSVLYRNSPLPHERVRQEQELGIVGVIHKNHALQDYNMQLDLLEQQNKMRLLMARLEQEKSRVPQDSAVIQDYQQQLMQLERVLFGGLGGRDVLE